jgi:hypothetical protein
MKILLFIFIKLLYWCIPLGLFVWAIFNPYIATYIFLAATSIFEGYLFIVDRFNKPNPDPSSWTEEEIEVIRKYHIALRYPFAGKEISVVLNGFRWSAILWIPLLLWNQMLVFAVILAANFLITGGLSVRLDPIYFLSDAVNRGKYQFNYELSLLNEVANRLRDRQ